MPLCLAKTLVPRQNSVILCFLCFPAQYELGDSARFLTVKTLASIGSAFGCNLGEAQLASGCVCVLLLAAPAVSRADTILFTNFGAGLSYNTGAANFVGNAFDGNLYAEGDTFTPSTTTKLSSIDIALSCMFGGGCPDNFTVSLDRNSGDAPSTALESFTVAGSSLGLLGANNAPLVLTSILAPRSQRVPSTG